MNKIYVIRRKSTTTKSETPFKDGASQLWKSRLSSLEHSSDDSIMVYVSSRKKANWWCSQYSKNYGSLFYALTPAECPVLKEKQYFMEVYYYYIDTIEVL